MVRIIRVNACKNCPNLQSKWNEKEKGYTDYACRKIKTTEDEDVIPDITKIPDWCLLEKL